MWASGSSFNTQLLTQPFRSGFDELSARRYRLGQFCFVLGSSCFCLVALPFFPLPVPHSHTHPHSHHNVHKVLLCCCYDTAIATATASVSVLATDNVLCALRCALQLGSVMWGVLVCARV